MANVPYSGVPTVEPTSGGSGATYSEVPQANAAAFGGGIGEAEQQAGQQTNQLAQKFADIYNQSTARDATTRTAQQMADAEAQFYQLKGNDAVRGLKPFQDQIAQIVKENSNGLSLNANSMYQSDSASLVNNAVFRAGAHAGKQAEQGHLNSLKGSIDTNTNLYAANADNPTGQTYYNNALHAAGEHAAAMGLEGDGKIAALTTASGTMLASAIKARVQSDPDGAQKLFDSSKGTFTYEDVDKDGKIVSYQVPKLDAAQAAQISSEMQGEFRNQFQDANASAQANASAGLDWDKDGFAKAAKKMGHTDEYIKAESNRLDNVQQQFGSANARYDLGETLKNDEALAYAGKAPIGVYDPDTLKKAFPKEPDKVQSILNEVNQLHQVAGFRAGFSTRTPEQNKAELNKFAPEGMSIADSIHQQESGGKENVSANGVSVGGWQVTPGTFAQYAKPGEDINNPKDNEAVGRRIIDDLSTKFNGDPARIAVGYFSGAGNVAPAGSPTPWINNTSDKNGKSVSSYVSDVMGRLSGANFSEQSALYEKMQKAAVDYYKQLNDDPAGTIISNDIKLNSQFQDAVQNLKDPSKMNDYVTAVAARQEALEIPEANRSVLPKAYATSITDKLMSSPETAPAQLAQMANNYGSNWPSIYKSLVQQGGLPEAYQMVQNLGEDPNTSKYGTMFARYLGSDDTKGKTDEILMGGASPLKTLNESVAGNPDVKSLTASFARSGASPTQVANTVGGIQKLAMAIHFYDPSDSNPAATAIKAMTSKYAYLPDGGARVPIDKLETISYNAQSVLDNIENRLSLRQFPSNTYADKQQYIHDLKSSPTWITDEPNHKIVLSDQFGRPVIGNDGKQISVGFNDPLIVKPSGPKSELTEKPDGNVGRGQIPVKGSLLDLAPTGHDLGAAATSVAGKLSSGVDSLAERVKNKQSQPEGLIAKPNANTGAGETPRKGSIADILGGN